MVSAPDAHRGGIQPSTDALRIIVDSSGNIEVGGNPSVDFAELRCRILQDPDKWLGVLNWVDAWAEGRGVVEELRLDDVSLWWFVRNAMIQRFRDLLPDVESVGALLSEVSPNRLQLENANGYWRDVCEVVAARNAIPLNVIAAAPQRSPSFATKLAAKGVSAARTIVGMRHDPKLRKSVNVLTLGYTAWRRVNVGSATRYIDPPYDLVLDQVQRLGLSMTKLNAPAAGSVGHQLTWLRRGDSAAIPIEYAIAKWWAQSKLGRKDIGSGLRQRVRQVLSHANESATTWKGFNVSGLVRRFLESELLSRANRAAQMLSFFGELLAHTRPQVVFLCHEYSGLAMAVSAAARRKRIPIVAVQHGVIWRAHHGYVLPREKAHTIPRADVLCVFGEYDRELILERGVYQADQVVVTGSPRLDLLVSTALRIDRSQLESALGLPSQTRLLLLTSIGEHGGVVAQRLAEALVASETPLSIIVKLHPSAELGAEPYSAAAATRGIRNMRVVREEFDLYDLFRLVDVHVSVNSTSLSEAALFDRPNIMLCTDLFSDTVGYLERNVAVAAESYPSLAAAVEDVLDGPAGERLRRGRKEFVTHQYLQLDGNASARVAAVIEEIVKKSS